MTVLADIAHGHTDGADILFLIALIVFIVGGVLALMEKAITMVLLFGGLACVALAWVLL